MENESDLVKASKILSKILRHEPHKISLNLDQKGWVRIDQLLKACRQHGVPLSKSLIYQIAEGTDKKRFEVRNGKIRATHGHSVAIDPGEPIEPPEFLYHGTVSSNLDSIFCEGLNSGNRQLVHLSADPETAQKVANRHGNKVVLLNVASGQMCKEGYHFYFSQSVWLTDHVPVAFLTTDYNLKK